MIPNMKEYARGNIEKAYRTNRVERITGGTIAAIEKELTTGEMAGLLPEMDCRLEGTAKQLH